MRQSQCMHALTSICSSLETVRLSRQTTMGSDPPSERGNTMDGSAPRFQHSAASLTALLKDAGFSDVSIKVKDPLDLYLGHTWAKFEDDGAERILLMFTAKK